MTKLFSELRRLRDEEDNRNGDPLITSVPEPGTGLLVKCDRCLANLASPGALLFGPPDVQGRTLKFHFCAPCWTFIRKELKIPRTPATVRRDSCEHGYGKDNCEVCEWESLRAELKSAKESLESYKAAFDTVQLAYKTAADECTRYVLRCRVLEERLDKIRLTAEGK